MTITDKVVKKQEALDEKPHPKNLEYYLQNLEKKSTVYIPVSYIIEKNHTIKV